MPCERSINGVANGVSQMGTERQDAHTVVLRPKQPYWVTPDDPLDDVMRRNAKHAVDSGTLGGAPQKAAASPYAVGRRTRISFDATDGVGIVHDREPYGHYA